MLVKLKKIHFSVALVLWTLLMAYLLLFPDPGVAETRLFKGQDKVAHMILFFVWSFLIYIIRSAWDKREERPDLSLVLWILVVGILLAAGTEWLQGYMPNRSADLIDFLCDLFGAVLGLTLGFFGKKELILAGKKFDK